LKVGDVVTGINGKPLSGPGDVARLYQLLIKSERVSVDVLRAGNKMDFGLQVTS
jgi:type II secretory pathway component PulC